MFRRFRQWRRKKAINKVKSGDGHALKPYRWWELLFRSLFYARLPEEDGLIHLYAVHVNYFSEESACKLYRDGVHYATSKLPAIFPVPDGVIEVQTSTYGLKRMHYVKDDHTEYQLYPDSRSPEGLRMRLETRFPRTSSAIGMAAIIILIFTLVLGLPQLAALISQIPYIADNWGSFDSPIVLPNWLNISLGIAGTIAAIERALTLRSHWLIDMETSWWDKLG